jgi:hypothetical protein
MALLKSGHPWNPGYALPQNVLDEPLGRGTFTSAYAPRGLVDTLIPNMGLGGLGSLGGSSLSGHSLSGSSLSGTILGGFSGDEGVMSIAESAVNRVRDHRAQPKVPTDRAPGFLGDPIAAYGKKSASVLLAATQKVPHDHRKPLLREMLNHIDPTLWDRVGSKAKELQTTKGYTAQVALQRALSICMASGLLNELDAIGKGKKSIKVRSHLGLGMYGVGAYQEALGFSFSSITNAIGSAAKAVGSGVATAAKATYGVGKDALNAVGNLACGASGIASSVPPVTPATAGVAAGASIVKGVCGGGKGGAPAPQPQQPPPQPQGFMSASVGGIPIVPIAIGGAGLLAIYLITRKKG